MQAEQRCAEAVQTLKRIPEEKETLENLQRSLKDALEVYTFAACYVQRHSARTAADDSSWRVFWCWCL